MSPFVFVKPFPHYPRNQETEAEQDSNCSKGTISRPHCPQPHAKTVTIRDIITRTLRLRELTRGMGREVAL
jgi:hypothetical protein